MNLTSKTDKKLEKRNSKRVNLRIQCKYKKIQTRKNSKSGHSFSSKLKVKEEKKMLKNNMQPLIGGCKNNLGSESTKPNRTDSWFWSERNNSYIKTKKSRSVNASLFIIPIYVFHNKETEPIKQRIESPFCMLCVPCIPSGREK